MEELPRRAAGGEKRAAGGAEALQSCQRGGMGRWGALPSSSWGLRAPFCWAEPPCPQLWLCVLWASRILALQGDAEGASTKGWSWMKLSGLPGPRCPSQCAPEGVVGG